MTATIFRWVSRQTCCRVARQYQQGESAESLAAQYQIPMATVATIVDIAGVTPRDDLAEYLPTPAMIAEACHQIRQTWSPRVRRHRAALYTEWTPPLIRRRRYG